MKNKILTLILTAMIAATLALSACSGRNGTASADAQAVSGAGESAPDEIEAAAGAEEFSDEASSPQKEEDEQPKMVRINADVGLRMRKGPGTDYEIIKLIPDRAYAEIAEGEEDNPDWLYVSYDGDSGWVSKEYISYESGSDAENDLASWAKAYYDYLSTFESMTYTSTMYGGSYTVAGRTAGGEKIPCSAAEFRSVEGYGHPVLVCWDGEPLDDEGNMDGPVFVPYVYLVESARTKRIEQSDPEWQALMLDGEFAEPKGSLLVSFAFKPEDGGGPEEIEKVLEWLKTQN